MGISVLIVDDCAAMQTIIRRVLAISGLEVDECRSASSGAEALLALRSRPADIMLADVNMPGMDGEELLRRVIADPALRGTAVVMVSSDSTRDRRERLLGLGAKGYVVKPFAAEALRAEVERVMEKSDD